MLLKGLIEEDFLQYKEPSMFLIFPSCTMKCDRECGRPICQNSDLASASLIEIEVEKLVQRYLDNPITKAIVCGGLEPMDSFEQLVELVRVLRRFSADFVVVYTGYRNDEIEDKLEELSKFPNIIVKFGRYVPDQESHFDEVLGVNLASSNQYAARIS